MSLSRQTTADFRLLLAVLITALLVGCASGSKPAVPEKIGMHIDAELEFAIAYPLDWRKERRVPWRKPAGSVVWTLPGTRSQEYFEVTSLLLEPATRPLEERLTLLRDRQPGLTIEATEAVELPSGKALHLTGGTEHKRLAAYLVRGERRDYLLALSAAPENFDRYSATVEEMVQSFQILADQP